MKRTFLILLSLLFIGISISAQVDKDFPSLTKSDIGNTEIIQEKYFDGTALWGHIDGGADLYIEYGFDKLLFQEIEINGINFRVEYYRMKNPESAFGIFSVSRFKCENSDTLTKFICITKYQVQSAVGRFYISIANDKGTTEAKNKTVELFSIILNKCNEKTFILPEPFEKPNIKKYSSDIKLFKGTLGIQNGLPLWVELFDGFSNYQIVVVPIENDNGYVDYSRVKFASSDDRIRFMRTIGFNPQPDQLRYKTWTNGIFYIVKPISETEIFLLETVFSDNELHELIGNY